MFSNVGKSETPALPFIVNGEKQLFGLYVASSFSTISHQYYSRATTDDLFSLQIIALVIFKIKQ